MYSALKTLPYGAISSRSVAFTTFATSPGVFATRSATLAYGIRLKSLSHRRYGSTGATKPTQSNEEATLGLQDAIVVVERTLKDIQECVDFDRVSQEIRAAQTVLEDPQLWITNPTGAAKAQSRLSDLQYQLATRGRIRSSLDRLIELSALADKAADIDLQSAVLLDLQGLLRSAHEHLISLCLSRTIDQNSAYVDIRAESGETEACDWAAMLARMYTKWAHSRSYAVKTVEETPGDVAGTRATTLLIEGRYAYGYAQYESGIHHLIRISPFDGALHTSDTSVRVSPCLEDDSSVSRVELKPTDLQITTMRSQVAGGQLVDKAESAVRVVHIPTGITASCQQEHSEHQNRVLALSLLKARLYDAELQKEGQGAAGTHDTYPKHSWDSQIRTCILQPYRFVRDLRTGYEVVSSAVQDVLDGDLNGFMEASLRKFKKKA